MYSGLLIILLPLIAGYLIPVRHKVVLQGAHRLLGQMVYLILFLMGISLAFLENLSTNLQLIFQYAGVFILLTLTLNLLGLLLLEHLQPWHHIHKVQSLPSRWHMTLESLKLCGVVVLGFLLGLMQWHWLTYATQASEYALLLLLLLVGIQLRGSGMTLRQILINRRGLMVALVVLLTSLLAGAIAAGFLGLPLKTGLAMASGFGWYSLSSILVTDAYGPVIGSATFFNDLIRELLAIMLIPALIQRHRSSALGLCGATSMDFTLPVLQRSGGLEIVPAAIVHGFILSLLAPVLIALFS